MHEPFDAPAASSVTRRVRRSAETVARDRALWSALLALRPATSLPPHDGAGYGHRRFAIIRRAAWVTLYRAVDPAPHIGVFLRCTGLAGEAFFTMADARRPDIEPRLVTALGPGATLQWGTSFHPGMTDVIAMIGAPFPWDEAAAGLHVAWLLRTGALWWDTFSILPG